MRIIGVDHTRWLNLTCNYYYYHWDWRITLVWIHQVFILSTLLFKNYYSYSNYQVGVYYGVDSPGSHTISIHNSLPPRLETTLMWTHQVNNSYSLILIFLILLYLQGRWLWSTLWGTYLCYLPEGGTNWQRFSLVQCHENSQAVTLD